MVISSTVLRLTWTVVEETPSNQLLALTDTALVKFILQKIAKQILLTAEEIGALYEYIGSRMTLIRDMAEARLIQSRLFEDVLNIKTVILNKVEYDEISRV